MNRAIHYGIFAILGLIFALSVQPVKAATVWTEQAGRFYKYDSTPKNLTDSTYKYILTTDIESAPSTWIKQQGTFIQYKSSGGGTKYAEEVIVPDQPPPSDCVAFMCRDDFGITFDLTKNTVNQCPKVRVTKEQVTMIYEGLQADIAACR